MRGFRQITGEIPHRKQFLNAKMCSFLIIFEILKIIMMEHIFASRNCSPGGISPVICRKPLITKQYL